MWALVFIYGLLCVSELSMTWGDRNQVNVIDHPEMGTNISFVCRDDRVDDTSISYRRSMFL
jgi:hypothetical protein